MRRTTSEVIDELTLAEASAWLTRLQAQDRTPVIEAAFQDWLTASPAHARAFARVNDVWELLPGAAATNQRSHAPPHSRASGWRIPLLLASACAALLLLAVNIFRVSPVRHSVAVAVDPTYQTGVGAQRTIVLDDNTRVTLNTDTRLVVAYRRGERRVLLEHGEALFQVVENAQRPFVVQTGREQVVDLGTTFDVRHDTGSVAVTLLEGKVWVGPPAAPDVVQRIPATVLAPGERLTVRADGVRVLDRPNTEKMLAWQQGQVYFDDTTLADATAELSRYGGRQIRFADPALAKLRISGVFSVYDPSQFATAVASLHNLHVTHRGATIVLDR
jgi:transmembrane sensor